MQGEHVKGFCNIVIWLIKFSAYRDIDENATYPHNTIKQLRLIVSAPSVDDLADKLD